MSPRRPVSIATIAAVLAMVFAAAVVIVGVADQLGDGPRGGIRRGGLALPAVAAEPGV